MSRSPFAYPLIRNVDSDAGGAADLQTDVMRFMAILALCLMAIFALVQSIPLAPLEPAEPGEAAQAMAAPQPDVPTVNTPREIAPEPEPDEPVEEVALTRPKWVSTFEPPAPDPLPTVNGPAEPVERDVGFTLRFESDRALMRLVAARKVGLYAIDTNRAQRMAVSESRISFWDASTPGSFHEMEQATVPVPVVDALARTGVDTDSVSWGVTLPGRMRAELDGLMNGNGGGSLVIAADGSLRLESGE